MDNYGTSLLNRWLSWSSNSLMKKEGLPRIPTCCTSVSWPPYTMKQRRKSQFGQINTGLVKMNKSVG